MAVALMIQILRALGYAHRRGIVHRDVKPQNVILDNEGQAKVADFGIARAGGSEMTETGTIVGTVQYLSPEQAQGQPVSPRSDLYSAGIVLYELLTGQVPFDAESPVSIALKQISERPVPPSQLEPGIPPALEAVVLRALEKDPARRFASADDFIAALEAAGRAPARGRRASRSRRTCPRTSPARAGGCGCWRCWSSWRSPRAPTSSRRASRSRCPTWWARRRPRRPTSCTRTSSRSASAARSRRRSSATT